MFAVETNKAGPDSFNIDRLPKGGYVVRGSGPPGMLSSPLFACSDIDAALAFIKAELEPHNEMCRPNGIVEVNKERAKTNNIAIGQLW